MLTMEMLSDMCCPVCHTKELRVSIKNQESNKIIGGDLRCEKCNQTYPIDGSTPNLIPQNMLTSAEWMMWQDHLQGLQERREQRIKNPNSWVARLGRKSRVKSSNFAEFTGITEGKVLDLGCGPGKFRFQLGNNVEYYGLDPIVLPDVEDFPFVRALSEYIPFKDNTFSHLVVLAALDHFKDLDAFSKEATRVLKPAGKVHIVQSIHEIKGPISAVKMLAHEVKDMLEDRATKVKNPEAPKHITEFSTSALHKILSKYFTIEATSEYNYRWYSPTKMFLRLSPIMQQ